MDRLDQRCHTEAIELRAQLSAAQARFKATKVEREQLRKARWNSGGRLAGRPVSEGTSGCVGKLAQKKQHLDRNY